MSSCLFLIATAYCYGQSVLLNGFVQNEKGEALPNVTIVAKKGAVIKVYSSSDKIGQFSLTLALKQTYSIELSSVGYDKLITSYTANTEIDNKTFTLNQKIKGEDTVSIVAKRGVYERGDTVFYNTDYYKRNNENNLKDLLNSMPGLTVTPTGKIIVGGEMVSKVLIDGKDLTGENYEKIVNNLSPHGLDQVQVLKKYKDPFELSNSATGNTEVAVNLTFKKKKIIPSAKASAGVGVPIKYYEHKLDFVVLTKPVTAINFININSVGNMAQMIASPNSLYGNLTVEPFKKLGKGLPYQNSVIELFLRIPKNYYSLNNTQYYDNSSQFNFGKKITNKFSLNYTPERIVQQENSNSQTFIGSQIFAQTNSQNNPIINRKTLSVKNELIYMIKKNEQIKINLNYLTEKENSFNNSELNNTNVLYENSNKKTIANSLLNYTKFLKTGTVINLAGFYEYQKNNEFLTTDGVIYNNTIFSNSLGLTKALDQQINNTENNLGFYVKFIKRKNDYSFTFQPIIKKLFGNLQSTLSAFATNDFYYKNIDSFKNDYYYSQTNLSFPIKYKFDINKIDINISIEPFLFNSSIHSIKNEIFNYNFYMQGWYEFKKKRRISLNISRSNDFTYLTKLFASNAIINNKNKMIGNDFLLKSQSYNFSINSYKSNGFSNKPSFNYRVTGNINTPNYLLNSTNNNFYTTQNYITNSFSNTGFTAGISSSLTSEKLLVRFENDISFSSRRTNASQNNILFSSATNNYLLETKMISRFKGMFNFQFNNSIDYALNKRIGASSFNKSLTDVLGVDINLNYMKKSHIDIEAKNYYFNTFNNKVQNMFLVNISYKQLLNNNKIRLNLVLNNVTNKKAFVSQNISINQFYKNTVALLPFFAMVKLEFLL